ncbi:hypothetical protein Sros01_17560 [Streptomyces roseochromogenus]|nr:hypothetical protein Sros01_17560 [Streptomyces roseochromogenus]
MCVFAAARRALRYPAVPGRFPCAFRRAICRWYRASFTAAVFPYSACGRSCTVEVVMAVSFTPQSMPITAPVGGRGRCSVATTNEAYQWPRLSRYTRTLDGAVGRSLDHTTLSMIPPARCRRPSLRRKPRRV